MYNDDAQQILSTKDNKYTQRLVTKQFVWWKKIFDVQKPYRWNLRRLNLKFVLDIGCGIGRNLTHLKGYGVGIDHNLSSVEIARKNGLLAFTIEEFQKTEFNIPGKFDSILLSHIAEHMNEDNVIVLLNKYIPLLKPHGKVILITPQDAGYRSDQTHIQFMDFEALRNIIHKTGLSFIKEYSFPFPRIIGRFFKYNEFICISKKQ